MRALMIVMLVAGCGRIGFDSTGDGGMPDADVARCGSQQLPLRIPVDVATPIALCSGDTWFDFDAPAGRRVSAHADLPPSVALGALSFELESADGVRFASPVWTTTSIAATGTSSVPAYQRVHFVADAEVALTFQVDVESSLDHTFYIAPDGSDAAAGSENSPWQTWPYALRQLGPGDTLIVRDGSWTDRETCDDLPQPCLKVAPITPTPSNAFLDDAELFDADCFAGVTDGLPGRPITILAEHQRRALVASSGRNYAYRVAGCDYWILDGLRGEGMDAIARADEPPERVQKIVFIVDQSPNFVGRNLLGSHANRCANDWVFGIGNSPHSVIEDSEAYDFSRHGFFAADTAAPGVTFRRVYSNGRAFPDVACSMTDQYVGPDTGVTCYHYNGDMPVCFVDNSIAEHVGNGFYDAGATSWRVTGSMAIDTVVGFESRPGDAGEQGLAPRAFMDIVSLRSNVGIRNVGNSMRVTQATLIGATGLTADHGAAVKTYDGTPTPNMSELTNVLALDNERAGFDFDQAASLVQYSSAARSPAPFLPGDGDIGDDAGQVQRSLTTVPTRVGAEADRCLVYVPADDVLATAGQDANPIGASIVHRTKEGSPTANLLWNQRTGAFPCGAIIPGVNDVPGASCFDVHERLHVGTPGCPIPR